MRMLFAAILVAGAAAVAGPVAAADFPTYPPVIEAPDVDYGVQGAFYLRGSAAGNALWSKEVTAYDRNCQSVTFPTTEKGYGYSLGAGFGYETGTGLRVDATIDYLSNDGLAIEKGPQYFVPGKYSLNLRSTIALANVYYDFSFANGGGAGYSAAGGAFGYVGAGIGAAYNQVSVNSPAGNSVEGGNNTSLAAAGMVGVGYDFGAFTADVGYRGLYLGNITNSQPQPYTFSMANNWVHEIRTSLRYRIN